MKTHTHEALADFGRAMLVIICVAAVCAASGCLHALKEPIRDHAIQSKVIVDSCARDGYGLGRCSQTDLDAMAAQACLIDAAVSGRDGEECVR